MRYKNLFAAAAAIVAAPFMTMAAQAATCDASLSGTSYSSAGPCSVGPVTFSNIDIVMSFTGGGTGTLTSITGVTFTGPTGDTEYGLALKFDALVFGAGSTDIAWTYNVSANLLSDAVLSVEGGLLTGNLGGASVSETIQPAGFPNAYMCIGISNSNCTPDTVYVTFGPAPSAFVTKDEITFAGPNSTASASILTNAFSVTTVTPLPAAVWMFGSVLAGAGGVASWRRKRKAA
jgi:hypothetical protein